MFVFEKYIIRPFLQKVEHNGGNNAFCIATRFYTYKEFAQCISKIRKAIQLSNNTSRNIGVVANDDIETYATIFALWLEGYAYVPLHPQQPIERSLEIISQSDIELIINSSNYNIFSNIQTIDSSRLEFDILILQPEPTPDNSLAYILFTSGSTGKPKGVPITRSNIGAFIKSFLEVGFEINHLDRCLQCFDLTFDVSVQSFLIPLTKGACIYTIPHNQIKYSYVYGLLEDQKLTFSVMAPSMLRYLRPYFDELNIHSMKYCILTAEASPVDLLKEWSDCIPNAEIYNFYGPTEATIYCTYYKFNRDERNKQLNGLLSIGKSMNGLNAIILDEDMKILQANEKGELCISGDQLSPGYWNNPSKNKESFFNIVVRGKSTRFYKTGDSCYIDDDDDIMLVGRLDYQVKIQGYRVELGEIEHHSRSYLSGQNTIALVFENKTGNTEICLCVEGELANGNVLLDYLKSMMPSYMIPTKVFIIKHFPLNTNGKVDRNMLKKEITILL